jgi:hypothetical protein
VKITKGKIMNETMKNELIEVVKGFKEKGINLTEDYPLFRWGFPELPNVEFQLLIMEKTPEEVVAEAQEEAQGETIQ